MTLHVAIIGPGYVMVVGDRLLSAKEQSGNQLVDHDRYANKAVVAVTQNGILTVAYAGLAAITGIPTDQWIVRQIAGRPLTQGIRSGTFSTEFGPPIPLTNKSVIDSLTAGVERDFLNEPWSRRKHGVEFMVAGWSWRRRRNAEGRRPKTYVRVISHGGKRKANCHVEVARTLLWSAVPSNRYDLRSIGAEVDVLQSTRDSINGSGQPVDVPGVETVIVQQIRAAARKPGSGIGTNLMSVRMSPAFESTIWYLRDVSQPSSRLAFSPAVVTHTGALVPPLVIDGDGLSVGGILIRCNPPFPPSHRFSAYGAAGPPPTPLAR